MVDRVLLEQDEDIKRRWPDKWAKAELNTSYRNQLRRAYAAQLRLDAAREKGARCGTCEHRDVSSSYSGRHWCRRTEDFTAEGHLCSSYQPKEGPKL